MHTYVKLKNGEIKVLFSDNIEEETVDLYEIEELEDFDPDFLELTTFKHSEILVTDSNLAVLEHYK